MGTILQLSKSLLSPPEPGEVPGVAVRCFRGPADIPLWLEVRHRAFAREPVGIRRWDESDFEAELLAKPWWSDDRLWFAEARDPDGPFVQPVGTVVLAERAGPTAKGAVHWLAVLPGWRGRGVGRLLVATLERRAWELGYREVVLETHSAWRAAARLYASLGYRSPQEDEIMR